MLRDEQTISPAGSRAPEHPQYQAPEHGRPRASSAYMHSGLAAALPAIRPPASSADRGLVGGQHLAHDHVPGVARLGPAARLEPHRRRGGRIGEQPTGRGGDALRGRRGARRGRRRRLARGRPCRPPACRRPAARSPSPPGRRARTSRDATARSRPRRVRRTGRRSRRGRTRPSARTPSPWTSSASGPTPTTSSVACGAAARIAGQADISVSTPFTSTRRPTNSSRPGVASL